MFTSRINIVVTCRVLLVVCRLPYVALHLTKCYRNLGFVWKTAVLHSETVVEAEITQNMNYYVINRHKRTIKYLRSDKIKY